MRTPLSRSQGKAGGENSQPPQVKDRTRGHELEPDSGAMPVCGPSHAPVLDERCTGQHRADPRVGPAGLTGARSWLSDRVESSRASAPPPIRTKLTCRNRGSNLDGAVAPGSTPTLPLHVAGAWQARYTPSPRALAARLPGIGQETVSSVDPVP